jgi:colanic acid biosynthesis glycosyl transferase WcaI
MKIFFVSRDFYPDEVAISLYVTDLAEVLSSAGHTISVICGDYRYDDPSRRLSHRETWHGISIRRVWATRFPKQNMGGRILNSLTFSASTLLALISLPRGYTCMIGLTTPPMISLIALFISLTKNIPFVYWVMDFQPDEAIAAGVIQPHRLMTHMLRMANIIIFRKSALVVALDKYMRDRLIFQSMDSARIVVIPPWSSVPISPPIDPDATEFRAHHTLVGKYLIMYSGNHSICHPLDTLLAAAKALHHRSDIVFVFVGGGVRKKDVSEFRVRNALSNIVQIAFQPRSKLVDMLCAADLHVTIMGTPFVGIIHPSKIYAVVAVGRPLLVIGPEMCAAADLLHETGNGSLVGHGEVERTVAEIMRLVELKKSSSTTIDQPALQQHIARQYSRETLTTTFMRELSQRFDR